MKNKLNTIIKWVAAITSIISVVLIPIANANAAGFGVTLAPMNQKAILIPGDEYEASFKISNPVSETEDAYYKLSVEPFYINDKKEISYEAVKDSGEIVKWISFEVPTEGKVEPNEVKEIKFKVDVPKETAAGGQYAAIIVTIQSKTEKEGDEPKNNNSGKNQATIKETKRIAHLFYAEIAGNTIKKGTINEISLPSIVFSGNIKGSSSIKNEGNVHGDAIYKLEIYPLFSNEEIYTNAEEPETRTILPEQTIFSETAWDKTPNIGIFKVIYTVDFEGSTAKIEKIVVKCPIWLLFIVIFIIIALIVWIFLIITKRKKTKNN